MKTANIYFLVGFLISSSLFASGTQRRPRRKSEPKQQSGGRLTCVIERKGQYLSKKDFKQTVQVKIKPDSLETTNMGWASKSNDQNWKLIFSGNGNVIFKIEENISPVSVFKKKFDFSIKDFTPNNIIGFDTNYLPAYQWNDKFITVRLKCD